MRRILGCLCLVFVSLSFFLAGCSKSSNTSIKDRVSIVWVEPPGNPVIIKAYTSICNKFRAKHPEINLKVIYTQRDYETKILTMIAGKSQVDAIFFYPENFVPFVSKNILLPLDDFINNDKEIKKTDYYSAMTKTFSYNGKLFGLPKDASTVIMVYNKDMFDKAGLKYPDENWTMDNFLSAAKIFSKQLPDRSKTFGTDNGIDIFNLVLAFGGKIMSDDNKKCLLNSKEAIEAVTFYNDLSNKYHVMPLPFEIESFGGGGNNLFLMGKVAMHFQMYPGTSVFRQYCKKFKWDIALMPKGKAGRKTQCAGSAIGITTTCKNPQAAWEFIKFVTTEGMNEITDFEFASYKKVGESAKFLDPKILPENKKAAIESTKYMVDPPKIERYREMIQIVFDTMQKVYIKQLTPKEACNEMTNKINKLLSN